MSKRIGLLYSLQWLILDSHWLRKAHHVPLVSEIESNEDSQAGFVDEMPGFRAKA